jgi:L-fuconolactonase
MDRRAFLAAAAASSAASLAAAQKDKPLAKPHSLPIVDTHQHLWDLNKFKLAWFDPDSAEGKILGHSFTPKEYAEATRGLNVVKAVYMEVDVVPEQQQKEADYIVELCASGKTPTCAAVVSGRPNSAGFAQYAKQFKGSKYVKGIRQVLHVKGATPAYFLDKKFVKGIQLLGDLGLSFDLCVRPEELPEHIQLVDQCPGTRFILDHCGNGKITHKPAEREQWKKNMTAIGKRKNVDPRRPRPDHQSHARVLRPRTGDVRRRLARLLARRRKIRRLGECPDAGREGPLRGAAAEAVSRQRGEFLRAVAAGGFAVPNTVDIAAHFGHE